MAIDEPGTDTDAMNDLPAAYSKALRLRDSGTPATTVADFLDVDIAALPMLYAVAEAKLAHARQRRGRNV